jgi:diadenosine tetraphosphatase ApaH/serine/threonine PP2A family protein phosphatase
MDLPLICILHCNDGNVACLHGGIPLIIDSTTNSFTVPLLNSHVFKNREIFIDDMDSVTQQLLWNDPMVVERTNPPEPYYPNRRGLGYIFGKPVFDEFCRINDVQLVFRGHQAYPEGLRKFFSDRFVTIFSASDYSNRKIIARFIEMDSMNIFSYEDYIIQEDPRLF